MTSMKKTLALLFGLAATVSAMAQAPEGWKPLKGENQQDGQFLGAWESEDGFSKVKIWKTKGESKLENLMRVPGLDTRIDPQEHPVRMATLPKPLLGIQVRYPDSDDEEERRVRSGFFVLTEKGSYELRVSSTIRREFSVAKWDLGRPLQDDGYVKRDRFKKAVDRFNEDVRQLNLRPIKIDPKIVPPVADAEKAGNHLKVLVTISKEGKFLHGGKEKSEEDLLSLFAKEVGKADDAKCESVVLRIKAHKETDFSHVRRLIRLAAKGGIDKVAFGSPAGE